MDEAIVQYMQAQVQPADRRADGRDASRSRSASPTHGDDYEAMEIKGRDLVAGLPKTLVVNVRRDPRGAARSRSTTSSTRSRLLERTPPELAADIVDNGIVLTGGGALLRGLDVLLREETGLPSARRRPAHLRGARRREGPRRTRHAEARRDTSPPRSFLGNREPAPAGSRCLSAPRRGYARGIPCHPPCRPAEAAHDREPARAPGRRRPACRLLDPAGLARPRKRRRPDRRRRATTLRRPGPLPSRHHDGLPAGPALVRSGAAPRLRLQSRRGAARVPRGRAARSPLRDVLLGHRAHRGLELQQPDRRASGRRARSPPSRQARSAGGRRAAARSGR